jgi:hypothetical protein
MRLFSKDIAASKGETIAADVFPDPSERSSSDCTAHSRPARTSGVARFGSGESLRRADKSLESGGSAEQKQISRRFLLQDQRHGEIRGGHNL